MAIVHDTIRISAGGSYPSLGSLLGSRVSTDVFDAINARGHAGLFGSDLDHMDNEFFVRHILPMDQVDFEISRTVNAVMNPDRFRILETIDDFRSIPPSMEIAIAMFPPVLKGMREGRMEGFGWDPTSFPDEDVYGRLIDNMTCNDVAEASDENGRFDLSGTYCSDDPDMSDDDRYSLWRTRETILNYILKDTDRDPTAIDLPRG